MRPAWFVALAACSAPPARSTTTHVVTSSPNVAPQPIDSPPPAEAGGWAKRYTSSGSDPNHQTEAWRELAVDRSGRAYAAGEFDRTAVLARFGASGEREVSASWVETFIDGLAIDPSGDVVIAGHHAPEGTFVAKLSPDLVTKWVVFGRSTGTWNQANNLSVDRHGRIAISGYFLETLTIAGGKRMASNVVDGASAFVAVLSAEGKPVWSQVIGDRNESYPNALAFGDDGSLFAASSMETVAGTHDRQPLLVRGGQRELELRRYRPDGTIAWTRRMPGTCQAGARDLIVTPAGEAIVAATLFGSADFGKGVLDAGVDEKTSEASIVAKYGADGTPIWVRYRPHTADREFAEALALAADGSVIHAGFAEISALDVATGAELAHVDHEPPRYRAWGSKGLIIEDLELMPDGTLAAVGMILEVGPRPDEARGIPFTADRDAVIAKLAGLRLPPLVSEPSPVVEARALR